MFELSVPIWQYFRQSRFSFRAADGNQIDDCPGGLKTTGLDRPKIIIFMPEMNR